MVENDRILKFVWMDLMAQNIYCNFYFTCTLFYGIDYFSCLYIIMYAEGKKFGKKYKKVDG